MKILFLSDIHHDTWKHSFQEYTFLERLEKAIQYWFLDLGWERANEVHLILWWDFFSSYSFQEMLLLKKTIEEINRKNNKGEDSQKEYLILKNNDTYQEIERILYLLEKWVSKFLSKEHPECFIASIIISPGNHEFWDNKKVIKGFYRDNEDEINNRIYEDIIIYPKNNLFVLEFIVKEVFWIDDVIIGMNFESIYSVDNVKIISGALFSPLINFPSVAYNAELETDTLIDLFSKKETCFSYRSYLEREMETWELAKRPLWEEPDFSYLAWEELNNFLKNEYNKVIEYNNNEDCKKLEDYRYYNYFAKLLLYFLRDVNNIIRDSEFIGEDNVLVINHHFPFHIREKYAPFVEDLVFEEKYLYPFENTQRGMVEQFFNIDIGWLLWLLPKLKQKKIILLNWHTHEQYKASFSYMWKEVMVINNNLWYWG